MLESEFETHMTHLGTKVIETSRLILRPFILEDAIPAYFNWCSEEEVTQFLTWKPHEDLQFTVKNLFGWVKSYEKKDFYHWAIVLKEINEPIGSISVIEFNNKVDAVHIGYCLGKKWWNKGYTSEAFSGIIPFFFEEVKVKRIESRHDPNNVHSGNVMKKCGLQYEGTLRQADVNNQGLVDATYYGLLAHDWKKPSKLS